MSSTKRILGDYTIESLNGNVNIIGNLVVAGSTTSVTRTDTSISDNIITLNAGETGSGVTLGAAGIEVDRGQLDNVSIVWNEEASSWQYTNDGFVFNNIGSGGGAGGGLSQVADDTSPELGGNLNVLNRSIYSSTKNISLSLGTVGSGGSGLFVTNSDVATKELTTVNKSIVYGIIFS
jgi:hypothetical protein